MARSVITLLVFGGAFAVGMATRRWRTPRPVLNQRLPEAPAVIVFLVVLFGLSWLTHRFVELPGQRWSRHRGLLLPQVQPGEQVVRR